MLFYKHAGFDDGSANWPIQAQKIDNGWNFRQVFAGSNGAVYAMHAKTRTCCTSMQALTTRLGQLAHSGPEDR